MVALLGAMACGSGSGDGWILKAFPPPETSTPRSATEGLLITVESSRPAGAKCSSGKFGFTSSVGATQLFCPPGGRVDEVFISGHEPERSCRNEKQQTPPPGEFVKIARIDRVQTWTKSVESEIVVTLAKGSVSANAKFDVRAEPFYLVEARAPESVRATTTFRSSSMEDAGHTDHWDLDVSRKTAGDQERVLVTIHGSAKGPCRETPCAPTANAIVIEP